MQIKRNLLCFEDHTKLNNSFKIKLDGKRLFLTTSVKYFGVLLDEHFTWSPQNLTCPDETQPSNWNTQQAKVPSKHSYTQNGIPFSIWILSSLCLPVMGSKQQRNTKSTSN